MITSSTQPSPQLLDHLARRTLMLLDRFHIVDDAGEVLYVWPRPDRAVLVLDPAHVRKPETLATEKFKHHLSTALNGRRVVFTNSRGLFLQIAYTPPPYRALASRALDLAQQAGPFQVPIGLTRSGPLWLNLLDMDSVLVGGARRMGKTMLLHAWIQALLHGGQAELLLWDGKGGVEFSRYAGPRGVTVAADLKAALAGVNQQVLARTDLFLKRGVTNLAAYNALPQVAPLRPIVLILDELAFLPEGAADLLADLVARSGAFGIHPVVGIQRPDADAMRGLLKANLTTRIALPVASLEDARIILGRPGAERLPKVKGRLALVWEARLIEAQAYTVQLSPALPSVSPAPALLGLSERELKVVAAAIRELEGKFNIEGLATQTGNSKDWVNDLAQRLEARGLLTPVQRNAKGHLIGRQVTAELARFAGAGEQAEMADQAWSRRNGD